MDDGDFSGVHAGWARNIICGLGRMNGATTGFAGNQPAVLAADEPERRRREVTAKHAETVLDPYAVAERGLVDDVIDPAETRQVLIESLALLRRKRPELPYRKHGKSDFCWTAGSR